PTPASPTAAAASSSSSTATPSSRRTTPSSPPSARTASRPSTRWPVPATTAPSSPPPVAANPTRPSPSSRSSSRAEYPQEDPGSVGGGHAVDVVDAFDVADGAQDVT